MIVDTVFHTVAALFVQRGGIYWNDPTIDAWDETRNALNYAGTLPVVAHPPCSRWCMLAKVNQSRYGHRVGDDGGCFAFALETVRSVGGVLEHPASTLAWQAFGLIEPVRGAWSRCIDGGWTTEVSQGVYGHAARKMTWLYYCGNSPPPLLNWGTVKPTAQCGHKAGHNNLPVLSSKQASATPPPFRDLLLSMARSSRW